MTTSLDFPKIKPTGRSFTPGDFANTKYRANSGAEFRILYGDKPTGMKLSLEYTNISDTDAQLFMKHYYQQKGTFTPFEFVEADKGAKAGWGGQLSTIGAVTNGSKWRYEGPPQLQSVYPGVSSVTVNLIAATIDT